MKMKRNIVKFGILLLTATAFLTTSCEEDTVVYDGSNPAAWFKKDSQVLAVTETSDVATIEVMATNAVDHDRTISVSVDELETSLTSDQYSIDQSTLVIPAGEYFGEIKVHGNFDALDLGVTERLELHLDAVDGTTIGSPNIIKVDVFKTCPIVIDNIGTSYTATVSAFGEDAPTFVPNVTKNGNVLTFDSMWGPDFVAWATGDSSYSGQYVWPGKMTIDATSGSADIVTTSDASAYPPSSGQYNACTGVITYTLNEGLFSGDPFTTDVTLTPN